MTLLSLSATIPPDPGTLRAALAALPSGAPVVVMIHGYRFSPLIPAHDPHRHILSLSPGRTCWKAVSWPRHLGLQGAAGLGIGFSWEARGTIWTAYRQAAQAGARLHELLALLHTIAPERPVHLFAHSLGARVALCALPGLAAGAVDRIILISAAAFRAQALRALDSPAGQRAEFINVQGRENLAFDLMLRLALPAHGPTLRRIGAGNWLDLPLDNGVPLAALGYRIAPLRARICHWSGYLRPGVFRLYRALLLAPAQTPLAHLRLHLHPAVVAPRGRFAGVLPLRFGQQRSS